jgi:CubicO group peptidase (beta-lactamase class C family)
MARFDAARHVLERAIDERAFPGAIVEVGTDRDVLWRFATGTLAYDAGSPPVRDDTVYDLASLTKVLSTASLVMREIERGSMSLDDVLPHLLPGCRNPALAGITIEDVLAHCAGFPAYRPFYQTLEGEDAFEAGICATPLEYAPRSQSIYSDLGFMLLGIALGRGVALPQRFDAMWTQMATGEELQFLPPEAWRGRTAPTERDPWRRRLLAGEVHDENAAALGGAAGHAGLFGTAPAVGAYARHLFQVLDGRTGVMAESSLRRFISRRPGVPGSSRALGWDTMLPTSSCGTRMSPQAFGHTGFTGTSLWLDPASGVYVVFLTNRVHPTRDNNAIQRIRPALHDAVMGDVRLPGRPKS